MQLYETMRTTFAARNFEPEAIPDDILYRILDNARFAPSGGNRQGWRVISIRDTDKRNAIENLMQPAAKRYFAQMAQGENPWNSWEETAVNEQQINATEVPKAFLHAIAHAPTLLLVLADLRLIASMDANLDRVGIISGASIYPFAWNILLAARSEGYGGTMTTFVTHEEKALQELLDIPDYMATCALLPMGKPIKQLTKLKRNAVETFAWHDSWEGNSIES